MTWTNHYLKRIKNRDASRFTSDYGIKIRRALQPIMKRISKIANGKKCVLVSYPKLEDKENYIFAAGHSFPGDIASNLSSMDRSAYTLVGGTDQVDHNLQMNFLWVNGLIYVNRLDSFSRKEAYKKMVRILASGTSVMFFPEGRLNNSENMDCDTLYPGVYHLSIETKKKVVPIVANYNVEDNTVLVAAGNPLDFEGKNKSDAKKELRDVLASLRFNLCRMTYKQALELKKVLLPEEFFKLNQNLDVEINRKQLTGDIHIQYMELRKRIYNEVKWTDEINWNEELLPYKERDVVSYEDAFSFVEQIDFEKINAETYILLKPIYEEMKRRAQYDFTEFMKNYWNKQ